MSEGPDPKGSLRPSTMKCGGGHPAEEGMASFSTPKKVDERY